LKTNNLKQTGTPHANQHSLREQLDANAHRTQHTIMLSLADSHSSLSQKKDKNTDRSLAHLAVLHSVFHSQKANRNQTETAKRASPISSALPEAQVSPHNNNSANQFNFILQN
jgi:hypothetical protein